MERNLLRWTDRAPYIAGLELQSICEALCRGGTQAVVVALCSVDDTLDVSPALVGRIEGEGCIPADRVGGNLIEIDKRLKVPPVAPDVGHTKADVVSQILLQGQIPLLY